MEVNNLDIYRIHPLYNFAPFIELPTCMYNMTNLLKDSNFPTALKQGDEISEMEDQQKSILQRLEDMKRKVLEMKDKLGISSDDTTPPKLDKTEFPQDIVIKANPGNPPLSLWPKGFPLDILSYIAVHTFGRMMIYPGSLGLLNLILGPMIRKGRAKLIENHGGKRCKLLSQENNQIDSIFIDRRNNTNFPNGNVLVVCCEGNSGFYEYGITLTPIEAGYSVLGWNHPGFGSSTGLPYPDQELNAMDVVMQFAISNLGFKLENIVIYAWSIGGFPATWAAMNYPNIKGLVLDATFDDLVALAIPRMPPSWEGLVVRTIRNHMDLNIGQQLSKYNGPVLLIRRTRDEIIATRPSRSMQTNRGNDLLISLLRTRYPKLVSDDTLWALKEWLSGDKEHQTVLWSQQGVEELLCQTSLDSYIEENSAEFPLQIGEDMAADMKIQLILYLADKHMIDFDSTHCVQLPGRVFRLPWYIIENQTVQRSRM